MSFFLLIRQYLILRIFEMSDNLMKLIALHKQTI